MKANHRTSPAPSGNGLSMAAVEKGGKVPCARGIDKGQDLGRKTGQKVTATLQV